jgi:hypothetical protein
MNAIRQELDTIDLGDTRLDRRARTLLSRFAENPQASIPAACRGWSETDAAYKFFANTRVDAERILKPHAEATLERCRQEPVVLLVQDTTELDYTHDNLPIEGLGVLDHRDRRGMHLHAQVAFTPEGCCLGVVGATFFTRAEESIGQARERTYWPIEQKESVRWLEGYRQACAIQRELIIPRVVSIADREADIYEIFAEREGNVSQRRWGQADFVIRAKENRSLPEKAEEEGPWCYQKLWSALQQSPQRFRRTLDLSATPQRPARQVTLAVRACELTLKPPYRRDRKLPPVTVSAVLAEEIDPPEGEQGVQWLLLSSLPIDRRDQIETILDYYRGRWPIEPFFRTLKTGCRVEELRLESIERLKPCVALYLIVAWRVMFVTMLGRESPKVPADVLFSDAEWRSVWQIVHQQPPPAAAPSLGEFLPILASLGGYLARRHDPPPGPQALWIGIRRMSDFAHAWLTFGPGRASKPP